MSIRESALIIDDEPYIREFVSQVLSEKYHVFFAKSGPEGIEIAREVKPDVIVLDILMTGQDGIETCLKLREDTVTSDIPIIMLTALNEPETRIKAFSAGADDYVAKPFLPEELLLRVKAKTRRSTPSTLKYEDVAIDLRDLKAFIGSQPLEIGATEFKILSLLLRKSGHLVRREEIEKLVWENSPPSERALDPHITALRKKLRPSRIELQTVYGQGFCVGPKKADA